MDLPERDFRNIVVFDDVESCLPEEVLVAWEKKQKSSNRSLEQLMNFLRQEVKGEEMVLLARTGLTPTRIHEKKDYHATQVNKVETTTAAAALVNMDNPGNGNQSFNRCRCLRKIINREFCRIRVRLNCRRNETRLAVFGKGSCVKDNIVTTLSMHSMNIPVNKLWELEVLGISSPTEIEKQKTELSLNDFNNIIKILPDRSEGRIVYRHCRVVFGVSSSPFLLNASIMHLLENCQPQHEEVAQKLKSSFYVDNCVSGVFNTDDPLVDKGKGSWSVFVENRVKEIRQLTRGHLWKHVPGNLNIADLLSRGCSPQQMLISRWWEGPLWLRESPEYWPLGETPGDSEEVELERKKLKVVNIDLSRDAPPWHLPLTYVSENPEELIPLTPSMFLISNKNSNIEDIELNSNSLNERIKYRRRDGKIRTVRLKTQHGKMLRPIQRIYPLEIRSNENLQKGLEESIPTVSETLSPDERKIYQTEIQPPVPLLDTSPTTSSIQSSFSKVVNKNSKRRRKRMKERKPDIEIKMSPHKPNKSYIHYTSEDEDMIVYDVEEDDHFKHITKDGCSHLMTPSKYQKK
ncbi:integrase catalytic domain-containing protein [Trichonephila clavipes]|nr:integrase catalytic domain-containing protein [Trichonephila clavipes]